MDDVNAAHDAAAAGRVEAESSCVPLPVEAEDAVAASVAGSWSEDDDEITVESEVDSPALAVVPPRVVAALQPVPKWSAGHRRLGSAPEERCVAEEEENADGADEAATSSVATFCEGASFDARAAGSQTRNDVSSKTYKHMFPSHAWPSLTQPRPISPTPSLPRAAVLFAHRVAEKGGAAKGGGKVGSRDSAQVPWSRETKHIHRVWIEGLQLPEGSMGDRVLRARLRHRRGPIGRVLSWPRRARQLGQDVTSGPVGRLCARDDDGGGLHHPWEAARRRAAPVTVPSAATPRGLTTGPSAWRAKQEKRFEVPCPLRCVGFVGVAARHLQFL